MPPLDLVPGTLELLILKAVSLGPRHGYGVLKRIEQISGDRLKIEQGSLYPALYRLQARGWIASAWGESENRRKARYYRLTPKGRRSLDEAITRWRKTADMMGDILETVSGAES